MTTLTIDALTLPAVKGWHRAGRKPYGAHYFPRVGWRLFFAEPFQGRVGAYGRTWNVTMPARGTLTLRPTTVDLTPFAYYGDYSDFSGGGAFGINPYGVDAGVLVHDRRMQRAPTDRLNIDTGARILSAVKDYNLSSYAPCPPYPGAAWPFLEADGEHQVRDMEFGIPHIADPIVREDFAALHENNRLFWKPYGNAILAGPGGKGHGYCGRSLAWAIVLATYTDMRYATWLGTVAKHVIDPATGSPQRLEEGEFYGSPDPWTESGVPHGRDVMQQLEQTHLILAFQLVGMNAEAVKLATTAVSAPKRKWLSCETGEGLGHDGPDYEQTWIALGALARIDRDLAISYAKRWPIMHPYNGSIHGPYSSLTSIRAALAAWGQIGKSRAFLECTA